MPVFPQLLSGATAQLPLARIDGTRRLVLRREDGAWTESLWDAAGEAVQWELPLRGLSEAEKSALEALFLASRGSLQPFVFLDPLDNLLRWSDDLSNSVWAADAGLTITPTVEDAFGGTAGSTLSNTTAGERRIYQTLASPGDLQYCFSGWIRSSASVDVFAEAGAALHLAPTSAGGAWRRFIRPVALGVEAATVRLGFLLPPSGSVTVCGLQAEAQPAASGYKRTTARSGVYPNTRFDQDTLVMQANGVNDYSTELRLVSRV